MRTRPLVAIALVLLMPLAGCVGIGDDDSNANDQPPENQGPTAEVKAAPERVWAGERVVIDGRNSTDPDGNISRWDFDFGDGTTFRAHNETEARVTHTYRHGGVYEVTLTVVDDGGERTGALSDTATTPVVIDERVPIGPAAVVASPANAGNATQRMTHEIAVNEHGDRMELNLTLESILLVGSSEVTVRLLGPSGDAVADRNVTVNASQERTVELDHDLTTEGTYKLEVVADSGATAYQGQARVYYDAPGGSTTS